MDASTFLTTYATSPFSTLDDEKQPIYNELRDDRDLKEKLWEECKSDLKNE